MRVIGTTVVKDDHIIMRGERGKCVVSYQQGSFYVNGDDAQLTSEQARLLCLWMADRIDTANENIKQQKENQQ